MSKLQKKCPVVSLARRPSDQNLYTDTNPYCIYSNHLQYNKTEYGWLSKWITKRVKQWGHWPALASLIAVGRSNIAFLLPSVRESMFEFVWEYHVDQLSLRCSMGLKICVLKNISQSLQTAAAFGKTSWIRVGLECDMRPCPAANWGHLAASACQSWRVAFHIYYAYTICTLYINRIANPDSKRPNLDVFVLRDKDIGWYSMTFDVCTSMYIVKTSDFSIFKCPRQQPCNFLIDESAPLCWVWHPDTIELFQLIFMIGYINHYVDLKTGPTVKLRCLFLHVQISWRFSTFESFWIDSVKIKSLLCELCTARRHFAALAALNIFKRFCHVQKWCSSTSKVRGVGQAHRCSESLRAPRDRSQRVKAFRCQNFQVSVDLGERHMAAVGLRGGWTTKDHCERCANLIYDSL